MKKLILLVVLAMAIPLLSGCLTTRGAGEGLFSNPILPDLNLQLRDIKDIENLKLEINTLIEE